MNNQTKGFLAGRFDPLGRNTCVVFEEQALRNQNVRDLIRLGIGHYLFNIAHMLPITADDIRLMLIPVVSYCRVLLMMWLRL